MKVTLLFSIFASFALAVSATAVHADNGCVTPPACGCDGDPAGGGNGKCCDCCGPGTNPWDGTVKAGFGLRVSDNYVTQQNGPGAAFPTNTYNFFNTDDARIYLSGSAFGGKIKGTLNTEVTGLSQTTPGNIGLGAAANGEGTFVSPNNNTQVALLDGICQFEFGDKLNFWMGRFLPPTDRANLDGPFYQTPYDYPFVSNYPSLLAGRDDGAAYWGQAGGGKLKWQLGLFNGIGRGYDPAGDALGPNATGNYMFIGRITVNLLDPEPGYYTQSCYFGDKEILAIGMTFAFQRDGGGSAASPADFDAESVDFLWEHRLGNCGVIDFEGAYYIYNYGITTAIAPASAETVNQGKSDYLQFSYLMPQNIGFCGVTGRLQPFARYQYYTRDFRTLSTGQFYEGVDVGVNYVISGYNARTTVAWGQRDVEGGSNFELLRAGIQLQF
jgi:hypothetical protein